MVYALKSHAESVCISAKIPQATRETDPTISKTVSGDIPNFRAPPTKTAPPLAHAGLSRAPRPLPPYIMINPWDGSSCSRQEFTNQLLAQAYLHPDETRDDREKMIWAISHFHRHAADEAGDFMSQLTSDHGSLAASFVGDADARARRVRAACTPDTWERFLYLYLENVEAKVARRREWWIMKALRAFRLLVSMVLWLWMWCAVVVLGGGLLVQLCVVAVEKSDVFWT